MANCIGNRAWPVDPHRCRKVLNMRSFPNDKTGKAWDHSVMQKNNYEVLVGKKDLTEVGYQFTLYGILKGNKPDFHVAMSPDRAKPFYASLVERFQRTYKSDAVNDGIFGAMMKVNLVNDGPITMQPARLLSTIKECDS